MTVHQKLFAVFATLIIFIIIISLIKNKKLQEEFSFLWITTGFVLIVMVLWYDPLIYLTRMIGAVLPTTTLFIFAIIFLMAISMHFALKISSLTEQLKNLAQEFSIYKSQHSHSSSWKNEMGKYVDKQKHGI